MSYKTVWKVIRKDNRNSACVHGGAELHYPVGKIVKPKIENSLIMAFEAKEHAENFINAFVLSLRNLLIVVKCKARVSERKYYPYDLEYGTASHCLDIKDLARFWDWSYTNTQPYKMPTLLSQYPGTVLCTQVIPLE